MITRAVLLVSTFDLLCLWSMFSLGVVSSSSNCSVAFYPMTACLDDGSRSSYIQFEECSPVRSRVRYAWLDVIPVSHRKRPVKGPDTTNHWTEITVPRWFTRRGRLTVFFTKDGIDTEGMQMLLPRCHRQ